MARGRDWRRFQRHRTIQRKVDILRGIDGDENVKAWTAGGTKIGRLSKGKIHCSCWMCRVKSYDYRSHMDARRIQGMRVFHHKTQHWYFKVFFPVLLIVQIALLVVGAYLLMR